MRAEAKIVEGPHVLYKGDHGGLTLGITVESLRPEEEDRKKGFQHRWSINEFTLRKRPYHYPAWLGITEEEYTAILDKFNEMRKECPIKPLN